MPAAQLAQVKAWAPSAAEGDLLLNAACDDDDTTRLLNEIRRNTR